MKEIKIKLYEFSELNEEAQKRAIEDARQWVGDGQKEINDDRWYWTMTEMERVLGIIINIGDGEGDCEWEFSETPWAYPGFYNDPNRLDGYIHWVEGRIGKGDFAISGDNILTGEWTDETFCEMMRNAAEYIRSEWTIHRFVDVLVRAFRSAWDDDTAYGYSDENVRAVIGCLTEGDAIYLANGERWNNAHIGE